MITRRQSLTGMAALGAATLGLAGCSGLRPGGGDSAAAGSGDTNTLVLGHAGSETDPRQAGSEQIKELIEERTDGRITVEIHANSTLGSWEQMIEGLQLGTTHLVIESILALEAYTDLAAVETAPFLYESDEQSSGSGTASSAPRSRARSPRRPASSCWGTCSAAPGTSP